MDLDQCVSEFGAAIDAQQATLLVGAGLSAGAGYPLWAELIKGPAARFGVPLDGDLPLAAQYIENQEGGRAALEEHLKEQVGDVEPVPTENHRLLSQLPVRDLWTTNYDTLIETANPELEVIDRDGGFVGRSGGVRRLHKMHGSIPAGHHATAGGRAGLVISRADYEHYSQTHPRFWQLLQAQFLTQNFLFLGFSLSDPNFDAMFRMVRLAIQDSAMQHYAVIRRPSDDAGAFDLWADDLQRIGISTVEIGSFDEVTKLLRRLLARTLPARLFVSGSYRTDIEKGVPDTGGSYPIAPESQEITEMAEQLGKVLATRHVPGLLAAGKLGATVGYKFLDNLDDYSFERFTLIRRRRNKDVDPPNRRLGQIWFTGEEPNDLRGSAFTHVRAVLVISGSDGTLEEIDRARQEGMSVIPFPQSGGAARRIFDGMSTDLDAHLIGQRRIDPATFHRLNDTDLNAAMDAAAELVEIALFTAPHS